MYCAGFFERFFCGLFIWRKAFGVERGGPGPSRGQVQSILFAGSFVPIGPRANSEVSLQEHRRWDYCCWGSFSSCSQSFARFEGQKTENSFFFSCACYFSRWLSIGRPYFLAFSLSLLDPYKQFGVVSVSIFLFWTLLFFLHRSVFVFQDCF